MLQDTSVLRARRPAASRSRSSATERRPAALAHSASVAPPTSPAAAAASVPSSDEARKAAAARSLPSLSLKSSSRALSATAMASALSASAVSEPPRALSLCGSSSGRRCSASLLVPVFALLDLRSARSTLALAFGATSSPASLGAGRKGRRAGRSVVHRGSASARASAQLRAGSTPSTSPRLERSSRRIMKRRSCLRARTR